MRNTPAIYLKAVGGFLALAVFFSSCVSTTLITSSPAGADVYIDSQKKGITPYSYSDSKASGAKTGITLKKQGYKDFNIILVRNEQADAGAIIGGIFVLIPFVWTLKYDKEHNYELQPETTTSNSVANNSSTNELVKLKNLLDLKAITEDDFTTLKVKILNDKYDYNNSIADQIVKLKELKDASLLTESEYISQKDKLVNPK